MKKIIFFWILSAVFIAAGYSQAGINYQAVARDLDGNPLKIKTLDVKFTISDETNDVWIEEHLSKITNEFGVFVVYIGLGERKGGVAKFEDIDWSKQYVLKTDIDFHNGNGYRRVSETELRWVPYALYALKTGNNGNTGGTKTVITYNSETHKLYQDNTLVADLTSLIVNTDNQELSRNGQELSISGGVNKVTLPLPFLEYDKANGTLVLKKEDASVISSVAVDNDPKNEIQQLRLNADTLEIFRMGEAKSDSKVVLPDLYEERDTIYLKGFPKPLKVSLRNELLVPEANKLSVNRGNTVNIDTDPTNEIQNLSVSNDKLKITGNAQATEIDLSPYKDNTDNQTLSINAADTTLQISGGNTLKISNLVNVSWIGFSCYSNAGLAMPGNQETSISWNKEFDDGNVINGNVFTAPTDGVYSFSYSAMVGGNLIVLRIYKGSNVIRSYDIINSFVSSSCLLKLKANETISFVVYNGATYTQTFVNGYFSGYRVH